MGDLGEENGLAQMRWSSVEDGAQWGVHGLGTKAREMRVSGIWS